MYSNSIVMHNVSLGTNIGSAFAQAATVEFGTWRMEVQNDEVTAQCSAQHGGDTRLSVRMPRVVQLVMERKYLAAQHRGLSIHHLCYAVDA